jgi:hypothetical protein
MQYTVSFVVVAAPESAVGGANERRQALRIERVGACRWLRGHREHLFARICGGRVLRVHVQREEEQPAPHRANRPSAHSMRADAEWRVMVSV